MTMMHHSGRAQRVARRTAVTYLVVAALWILLSDRAVAWLTNDPGTIERLSMFKGWFFVAVTAALLFFGLRRQLVRGDEEAEARQRATQALGEAEERQRLFIAHAPAALAMFDRDMRYLAASRRWMTSFKVAGQELNGRLHYEVFPHLPEHVKEAHRRGLAGEVVTAKADPYRSEDGTLQWLQWEVRPWRTPQGAVGGIVIFTEDITERIMAEGALRESEERYRLLAEHVGDVVWVIDAASMRFEYVSPSIEKLRGLTAAEVMAVSCLEGMAPESVTMIEATLPQRLAAFQAGDPAAVTQTHEIRQSHRDGSWLWVEVVTTLVRVPGGGIQIVGVSRSIEERKRVEADLRSSEERFRSAVESAPMAIFVQAGGRFAYVNRAAVGLFGAESAAALLGQPVLERFHDADRARVLERIRLLNQERRPVPLAEEHLLRLDGTTAEAEVAAVPFRIDGQDGALVFAHDITEQKHAREQWRLHETVLRETGEIAKVGGWSFDVATGEGFWTEEVARIHDLDPQDRTSVERSIGFYTGESRARIEAAIKAAVEKTEPYDLELELVTAKGRRKWVRTIGHPITEGGRVVRVRGAFQDVTSRKQAELVTEIQRQVLELIARGTALTTTLQRLLELVEAQSGGCICAIMVLDQASNALRTAASVSLPESYECALGSVPVGPAEGSCGAAAFRGEPVLVDDIASDPLWERHRDVALANGLRACWSFPIFGEQRQVLGTFAIYGRGAGSVPPELRQLVEASTHTAAIAMSRWRDETALRGSEARFRELAETINEVFWITNPAKSQMLYISPAYERIWGRSCASLYEAPRSWMDAVHPEERERVAAAVADKQIAGTYDESYRIVRPDGEMRWVRDQAFPVRDAEGRVVRIVGVVVDVTEKKRIETQFLRAQRLEAIGALAGGVAHDLNNILTPVLMAAAVLKGEEQEARNIELLTMIEQSARRGADIIRQLLTFSRGVEGARTPVQPRHLIKDMAAIVRETFPREITLHEDVAKDLWLVMANPTQLHQVLMNLCVNARDAMPDGGRLTLTGANFVLREGESLATPDCAPGPYVVLGVADTGQGMAPETMARIFEPFFTTKEQGKGTGLGLSTVLGIVRSHGGHVSVYSEPGHGSRFKVYLPATSEAPPVPAADAAPLRGGQGELVLVVDDEKTIREATRALLYKNGYRVIVAANGQEALGLALQRRDALALVVTDMMMPVMGGLALIRALRTIDETIPVVAASGLEQEERAVELAELGVCEVLSKPCRAEDLLVAVRRALDAKG